MADGWFIKYPKIRHVGHRETEGLFNSTVYITEKIDGANFRFGVNDGVLKFGSRNIDFTTMSEDNWPKRFRPAINAVLERANDLPDGYIFFAEYMVPHTIQYDWDKIPKLLGFDVWDIKNKRFLHWEDVVELFDVINIPVVPLLGIYDPGELSPTELDKLIPKSKFYDGIAEGIVIKNYDDQIFGKVISKQFTEVKRSKSFDGKDDTTRLFNTYFTEARIKKAIYRLMDEQGYELNMKMMRPLIYDVLKDVAVEAGDEIFMRAGVIDFRRLRKMLSARAQNILRRMMLEQMVIERWDGNGS